MGQVWYLIVWIPGLCIPPFCVMYYKPRRVNTIITPYYRGMHDSQSQDDKSCGIGFVLSAIKKSWRISQSALRSLGLMA